MPCNFSSIEGLLILPLMKIFVYFLTAMTLLSLATARGGTTAQTDLASITVIPLTRNPGAKADWQTIYDYSGGVLPRHPHRNRGKMD